MRIQFGSLLLLITVPYVLTFPVQGRSKNVKVAKRSSKDKMLQHSGLARGISQAMLDQPAEESIPKLRKKRTLAQLQIAWTMRVVCTDDPKHPDCKADIIDDEGRSYRSRHRRGRHHRRNRTRVHRQ